MLNRVCGSSPLARGKRLARSENRRAAGLIPARAGKTTLPMTSWSRSSAHPRSRGENRARSDGWGCAFGSSPLARGKRTGRLFALRGVRLIPARAGKTITISKDLAALKAHPRSRGENPIVYTLWRWLLGSSPLARGKPEGERQ